ncbi:hypothetical protein LUZ60_000850 [Juncus effusus]|nr:hypothetical protein LUZ60_000850 [Juncus effusus]
MTFISQTLIQALMGLHLKLRSKISLVYPNIQTIHPLHRDNPTPTRAPTSPQSVILMVMAPPLTTLHLSSFPPLLPLRRPSSLSPLSPNPHHRLSHICLATPNPSSDPVPPLASAAEIEMLPGRDGVFSARAPSVVILWDLDNKPPRGPPFQAAASLKRTSALLGEVGDFSAYANRHAFSHVPGWVRSERSDRRRMDFLEKKGLVAPDDPYKCEMCGRKFNTRPELKRHFKQLHERERMKKVNRLRSLKGKKKQKYRERYINGNQKYENSARDLITPKSGYGLASELRRAGVHVRTVEDKPQAADVALKKRVRESLAKGVDWMVLVSDDSDFIETVRMAREAELRTVVVGDGKRGLGREADIWLPWAQVENGNITQEMMRSAMVSGGDFEGDEFEDGFFTIFGDDAEEEEDEDDFDEDEDDFGDDIDDVFMEIIGGNPKGRSERGRGRGRFQEIRVGKPKGKRGRGNFEEFSMEMDLDEASLSSVFGSLIGDELFGDSDDDSDEDDDDSDDDDVMLFF